MATKNKIELTPKQKATKYKRLGYLCNAGSVVSIITPYIVEASVNWELWFKSEDGWKIGLGGALALAIFGIAVWIITANKEKQEKMTNGWITLIVGWFAIAFVFVLLSSIMNQIAEIMLWGGLGLCAGFGFDIGAKKLKAESKLYSEAINEVKKDTIKKELEKEDKSML